MKEVLLKDLQNVLPIGYFTADGARQRHFEIRPWRMPEEKAIGKILERGGIAMDKFIPECLALMVTKLGTMDFGNIPQSEKTLILHRMYYSDIMYAYIWMRKEAIGPELNINVNCPFCSHNGNFAGDLDTLKVKTVDQLESVNDLDKGITLRDGIQIGNDIYPELIIRPPTWMAMDTLTAMSVRNEGEMKRSIFQNSVVKVVGYDDMEHFVLTDEHMNSLTKYDMELLSREINDIMGGAQLFIEVVCSNCGNTFAASIQWDYERFFSHLSMPSNGMK